MRTLDTRNLEKQKELTKYFPIGTKYSAYRDRGSSRWDKDFTLMRECGINAVRINATWGTVEPHEGVFDFAYYDALTERAAAYGLKVLFTIYMSCSPEWVYEKHPDSRYVSAGGTVWTAETFSDAATGGWPGLCLDGEDHRKTVEAFLKVFTEHFKGNDTVLAFDIHHEPTEEPAQQYFQGDWREMMYCYCEHSKEKFRAWLRQKYGSLEGLNETWVRQYETWKQVEPPRTVGMYSDWTDWKRFRSEAQADAMQFIHNTVKKYDPDRATAVHTAIYETGHPIMSSNDHFKLAKTADMFGSSMYDCQNPEVTAFVCDLLRCANDNGPFWVGETGSGAGPMFLFIGRKKAESFSFSVPIDGADIFRQTWGQVARGAKGIFYWAWRPEISTIEASTLGFTERNGDRTERCDALGRFNRILDQYRGEFGEASAPASDTAIFYDLDGMFIEGLVSLGTSGSSAIEKNRDKKYYKDTMGIMGAYKLCMKQLIQPDFIDKEGILAGKLSKYKLLILPYCVSISSELGAAISAFVRNGGKVIGDAMLGYFTDGEWGAEVCPAGGLDDVFGLYVRSDYKITDGGHLIADGKTFCNTAAVVQENLVCGPDTRVIASFEDGTPAVAKHAFGEGQALYTGTLFFPNVEWDYSADTVEMFERMLDAVGYESAVKAEGPQKDQLLEIRVLEGQTSFVFLINHEKETLHYHACIPAKGFGRAEGICGEAAVQLRDGILEAEGDLEADGVQIIRLTGE